MSLSTQPPDEDLKESTISSSSIIIIIVLHPAGAHLWSYHNTPHSYSYSSRLLANMLTCSDIQYVPRILRLCKM